MLDSILVSSVLFYDRKFIRNISTIEFGVINNLAMSDTPDLTSIAITITNSNARCFVES